MVRLPKSKIQIAHNNSFWRSTLQQSAPPKKTLLLILQLFMPLFWMFVDEDHSTLQMWLQSEHCSLYFDSVYNSLVTRIVSAVHFSVEIRVLFAMAATLFIFWRWRDSKSTYFAVGLDCVIDLLHKSTSIVIEQDSKARSACNRPFVMTINFYKSVSWYCDFFPSWKVS